MPRPRVTSTLVGAGRVEQIHDAIAASQLTLTADQIGRLTEASARAPSFSDSLNSALDRRMVFCGDEVRGWGEAQPRVLHPAGTSSP